MFSRRAFLSAFLTPRRRKRRATTALSTAPLSSPIERRQLLRGYSSEELHLYLSFRLLDAVPLVEVQAEAERRGIG